MAGLSIRAKITLWFSIALVVIASISSAVVFLVGDNLIQKTIRDTLIQTVEQNVDEVEYYAAIPATNVNLDVDYFIEYGDGYLEIDDDFLDEVNDVYTSLYHQDGTFVYGNNPVARETEGMPFLNNQIQETRIGGVRYYVFDRMLEGNGLDGLWLRGVVSENQGDMRMTNIFMVSLFLLPLLVALAIAGGFFVSGRMLRPIKKINATASQIGAGDDLKQRIDIGNGTDELHQLADTFNDMIGRLDNAFETERQFTSDASHELRTPTAVIMAQCEFALENDCDEDEYRDALQVIRRQGKRLSNLINDMLVFTRLELKSDNYRKQDLDLTHLVESICQDMALIRDKGIQLSCQAASGIRIEGNRELLARLLTNLIGNAYRYGRDDGFIRVTLQQQSAGEQDGDSESIVLRVEDDGIGISKEDQENIFRRFFQVDSSRSEAGSGLGLAMVKEIAAFHDGTVTVSSAPGEGSIFEIRFETFPC